MIEEFSKLGLRTLALCYKDMPPNPQLVEVEPEQLETELTFFAVFGIEDPLRAEVIEAVRQCKRAGIVVRMVTGDNILYIQHNFANSCKY
jgi:magnesium-transporting ATPase (P-type)